MARKDFNVENNIKKVTPVNEWLLNVGKSLGFTTAEIVQDLMPNTTDFVNWNKREVKDTMNMLRDMRSNMGSRNMFNKQFGQIPQIKAANEFLKNMKDDIKSGKFNNQDRYKEFDDFDELDYSFGGLFGDDDKLEFFDDEEDTSLNEPATQSSGRPPVTVINTMPLAKAISANTEANVSTMIGIAEQQMAVETEKILFDRQSSQSLLSALGSINDNMSLLVEFNAESTAKYHAAALKYYEQSLEIMKSSVHKEQDYYDEKLPFTFRGSLKLDEYAKIVKENLVKVKQDSPTISQYVDMFMDPSNIKALAKNPVGFVIRHVVAGRLIPDIVKNSMQSLDESIHSFLPAILGKINTFDGNGDETLEKIFKVLGYKAKLDYDVDLSEYHKGSLSWDGESKKALVEVIPSYLRRIEAALTGEEERVFNYDKGKFVGISKLKEDYDTMIMDEETSGYRDVKKKMLKIVEDMNVTHDTMKQFEEDMNEYLSKSTRRGSIISHMKRRNSDGTLVDDFIKEGMFDYNQQRIDFFKNVLSRLSEYDLKKMATVDLNQSRINTDKKMTEVRFNPASTGYSALYNYVDDFNDPKIKYSGGHSGLTDRFGLSQLDYLRDIRSILIKGVRVFTDNRQRYRHWDPHADLREREQQEVRDYQERMELEEELNRDFVIHEGTNTLNDLSNNFNVPVPNEFQNTYESSGKITGAVNNLSNTLNSISMEMLYGDEQYTEQAIKMVKNMYKRGKGIIQSANDIFGDTMKAFKSYFTGQGYVTSDGVEVPENPDNIFSKMRSFFSGSWDKLKTANQEGGLIEKFSEDFMEGYLKFKVALFGERALDENAGKETMQNLMNKIKERFPKAAGHGIAAGLVKTAFASNLGILGNFLLPGGPIGAMLVGTTFGFLRQSETFNRYVFGEEDENGNRTGGLISKALQDKYKEYSGAIKKGAAVGLLGSFFLPGGPITGALLGIGGSLASRNEAFQEFLYGKDYKEQDKKSIMNGAFGKLFKAMNGGEDSDPKLAKFLGAAGLGVGIAQGIGFLPSFLLPGGPITGAMLGLAGGIAASSEKFQKFLLGDKDVDGKRYGGLLTQVTNWFNTSFMTPLKIKAMEMSDNIYGFMRRKLFDPLARTFEPVAHAMANVVINTKDRIVDAFTTMTSPIVEAFKDHVTRPLGRALKKVLINPLKRALKGVFKLLGKTLFNIMALPLKGIDLVGGWAERYNEKSAIKQEKRRRRKEFMENDEGNPFTRWFRSKQATHMTKEEKEQIINERYSYRDGKSRKQRKKEQKQKYKEDMEKRKARTDELRRQYEEDKAFGKSTKWKFGSKKQKEKREAELKEKAAWFQEQQLLKAQDTDEKVGKIGDNVSQLSDQQENRTNRVIDALEKIRKAVLKINGIKDDEDAEDVNNDNKSSNVIPFPNKQEPSTETIVDENNNPVQSESDNTSKPVQSESNNKGKVISLIEKMRQKLRRDGKSHADGLDSVPNDGYIAELHEGEMVVPEKPAGKLRNMMKKAGNGFKGLTNALSETSEDDVDHRNEEAGPVENGLLKGTVKGLRGMAGMLGSVSNMFGKMATGMSEDERRDREDNAMQLTDMEADRLKEMEDKARYEQASRKNVDYVQDKIAAEHKEDEERNWKSSLLNAVMAVGHFAAAGAQKSKGLLGLLGKGFNFLKDKFGSLLSMIGSLAIPLGVGAMIEKWSDYKNSEEYIESRTDVDADGDGEGDFIYDNTDHVIGKNIISARKTLITKPLKKVAKAVFDPYIKVGKGIYNSKLGQKTLKPLGEKIYNSKLGQKTLQPVNNTIKKTKNFFKGGTQTAVKEGTEAAANNVVSLSAYKAAKESGDEAAQKMIKNGSGKAVSKVVGEGAESAAGNKGIVTKLIEFAKKAIDAIANKIGEKFPGAGKLAGKLTGKFDDVFKLLLRNSDGLVARFAKKITALFAKVGAGAASGFIIDAVFAVGDLVSGLTAGNAGNLFGVSPENVDMKMRVISALFQVFFNFNAIAVVSLINEITSAMFNMNFLRKLAIALYNLISKNDLTSRITAAEIDKCTSIDEAIAKMGITDPADIAMLQVNGQWKNFKDADNEEFGGVISPTEQMELARLQYNLENGTKLSSQAFIDKESKTLGSKIFDGAKNLFTKKTAQQKINMLNTQATEHADKAKAYKEKAQTGGVISKAWNNSMAWMHEKISSHKSKKAAKKAAKAPEKQAKYQMKTDYHTAKAAQSTGIAKWYHNWRAGANQKKVERYTIENGKVVDPVTGETVEYDTGTGKTEKSENYIMPPEMVTSLYDIPEGEYITDGYGNMYDHNGNYLGNENEAGDAGMGEGEEFTPQVEYKNTPKTAKKDGVLKKALNTMLKFTPGGGAIKTGIGALSSLFGKNNRPEDYRMIPIMNENGDIVSYQSQAIDDTTEIEGFGVKNMQVEGMSKNAQAIPQMDEKGNIISVTTVDKNKPKGFLGKLAAGIGGLFGFNSTTNTSTTTGGSIDNSVTNTTSGDTYNTTTNEIDTTPFGPLTDAINSLVGTYGTDNVDEEGNVKTGGVLQIIMDPMGYLGKKLLGYGVDVYEDNTGKDIDDRDLNNSITLINMLRNPFGYLLSVVGDKINFDDESNGDHPDDPNWFQRVFGKCKRCGQPYDKCICEGNGTHQDYKCTRCGKPVNECICKDNGTHQDYTCNRCGKPIDKCICNDDAGTGERQSFLCQRCLLPIEKCICKKNEDGTHQDYTCNRCGKPIEKCTCNKDMTSYYVCERCKKTIDKCTCKDSLTKWGKEKIDEGKEWVEDKWDKTKEWGKDKWNDAKEWGKDKVNDVKEWGKKQYNKSDDVADIIMGDSKAKANILTTGISTTSDMITAIWNKFAPEDAQFAEGEVADFIATMLNKMIVKPFQELMDPVSKKWDETKEAVSTWVTEKKNAVVDWFKEKIAEPFKSWVDKAKNKVDEIKTKVGNWISDAKDVIVDWFKEKIAEPFKTWVNKAKTKIDEIKTKVGNWISDAKDAVVDWFKEKIAEPFKSWANKAKTKIEEMKTKAGNWISDAKDKIADIFKEKIAEPFKTWANKAKTKIEEMKEGAKSWISGMKDKIVEAFNENIKKPIGEALSPITTAVSGAWTSLKSAFEPIAGIFQAIKEKRWGDIAKIVKDTGSEGRENANADEDNLRSGPKPSEYQKPKPIKPIQHNINSSELLKPINTTNNNTTNKTSNKFVFYNQSDARWANEKIGNRHMKDSGCGPTSLAMAVSQLTGEQITPDTIAKLGQEHLPGYSQYSLFPSIADKLNMNYTEGKDSNFIMRNLKQGVPVVLSGRTSATGTPFTSEGHVVTASHVKGNMVYIQDPRGEQYSKYYPLNNLMNGLTKGMTITPSSQTDVSNLSSGGLNEEIMLDDEMYKSDFIGTDVGEVAQFNANGGKTGAGQITMADRVLSYARAFLNNKDKFSYSQPRRLQIDTNKSSSKGCGTDCSSFVSHVLSRAGDVNIYGTTSQTFWDKVGTKVTEPQIGDVVCQEHHVGLYSGDGNYIHMSGRAKGIRESKAIAKGNNPHRGYKRVLKNPSQMVDPTVPNPNKFVGTVVGTSSGNPVGGSAGGPQASLDKALLIGDSLTVGMKSILEGKYPNAKAMGKGGKWAKQWLEDLGSLPDASSVDTVIQWLGINGVHDNKANMTKSQELLTKLKEKYPGKPIFNMRIFPTTKDYGYNGYTGEWWKGLSEEFNSGMSSWAASNGVTQIDATNGFIQQDGYLDPSKAVDGIHFTTDGYKGVLANMEQAINTYNSSQGGTQAAAASDPGLQQMGVFAELSNIGNAMIGAIYNNKSFNEMYSLMKTPATSTQPGTTTPTDGTTPDISNISDNAQAVWTFFTGKGYSPAATAGIMGNLQQESGIDPTKKQYNGGPGRGLGQWTVSEERFAGLKAHAASKGKEWTDLQSQLEWIDMELAGKDPSTANILKKNYGGLDGFKKATDHKWAVEAFEKAFERAGNPQWEKRYKYAEQFMAKFNNAGTGFQMATSADPTGDAESQPESMNGWAYYRQGDPQWQEDISGKKIGPSGCGMASHAMMLTGMFGKKVTPVTVGKWARSNNYWNNGMSWDMPSAIAKKVGLNIVDSQTNFDGLPDSAIDNVKQQLKAGYPVILSGKSGDKSYDTPFTTGGHIVFAVGVDGNNQVIINDPRGPHRTKAYSDSGIMKNGIGMRGYWAFDKPTGAALPSDWISGDFTNTPGSTGTTPTTNTTASVPTIDTMGVFGKLQNVGTSMLTAIYNNKSFDEVYNYTGQTTTATTPSTTSPVSGSGNFPKYALNDQQLKGIANILQHEQPGLEGRMAEASLMANLVDKTGDDKATVDNLIKKATGGWFAKGKSRFNNPGNPEQISIDAARSVLVEGKRTLPRYVDEHDCFPDIEWAKNDGATINKKDRSQYKAHVTKIKNIYGASGTFHSFPNANSDPFYYTSEDLRKKWGEDCYSPSSANSNLSSSDAGKGDGKTYMVKPSKVSYSKSMESRTTTSTKIDDDRRREIDSINRKINVAFNNINASDPNAYSKVLQIILQELHDINANTAETAKGVGKIEIFSANEPVSGMSVENRTTAETYKRAHKERSTLQQINTSTGYKTARQIAGYNKIK